ncbi:MAG TPA: biliverdin-producing heme oxygenase [Acidobacteriaceae bacterium]
MRTETRGEHESVEALLPLMSPDLTRELYGNVLRCMHGVVHAWETWAAAHVPERLAGLVRKRRRDALLYADLLVLGEKEGIETLVPPPPFTAAFPDPTLHGDAFEAGFLGAMYVMEGSRLGGQHIARYVEDKLGLAPGVGDAYFRGFGAGTGVMWSEFKALLAGVPDEYTAEVISAAKAMFHYFADGIRPCASRETA